MRVRRGPFSTASMKAVFPSLPVSFFVKRKGKWLRILRWCVQGSVHPDDWGGVPTDAVALAIILNRRIRYGQNMIVIVMTAAVRA